MAHIVHCLGHFLAFHNTNALIKDHLALVIHDIVIFEQVFANVKISRFNFFLCGFQRLVDPSGNNGFALFEA